jgi:5'-3' exonuclease
MGIPSFYRLLCRKYARMLGGGAGRPAEWLCLDFNCAMYQVLRELPPGSGPVWEAEFRDAICKYLREIVALAAPTRGVYVSCDGVVCAAKRRQQRLRRFRSTGASGEAWDATALTPGTAFMEALGRDLTATGRGIAASGAGLEVIVSTTAEPGEGEHKLMAAMRARRPRTCTIYGLDADLILLALLLDAETGCDVQLLREAQAFESRTAVGGFRHLCIRELGDVIAGGGATVRAGRIRDYVATMSLLGNDFLPHGLTRTVHDDGVQSLLGILQRDLWAARRSVVCPVTGGLLREGVATIVRAWAATEERDMIRAVEAALVARTARVRATDPVEAEKEEAERAPARWCALGRLAAPTGALIPGWRSVIRDSWGAGRDGAAYLEGVAWVWDYYTGRAPICQGWVYDRHLPPLWEDLVASLDASESGPVLSPPPVRWGTALPAWTHLLAVLSEDSARRLLPAERLGLLRTAPWYWPKSWTLFDVGRTMLWQCEPVLPLIPEERLRELV